MRKVFFASFILVLLLVISSCSKGSPSDSGENASSQNQAELQNDVLAMIDGSPVTAQELAVFIQGFSQGANISGGVALYNLIQQKLIENEVARKWMTASQQEVDALLQQTLAQLNISQQQLLIQLDNTGISFEQYRKALAERVKVNKLIQQEVFSKVTGVSEEEVKNMYIANVNNLFVPAQARVRQILLRANMNDEVAMNETLLKVQNLIGMLNGTNFCELAAQYSEDIDTKDKCGEYAFFAGQLLPEFEQSVFSAQQNVPVVISSRLGYHITWVMQTTPVQVAPYDTVKEQLANQALANKAQVAYQNYIAVLWNEHVTLREGLSINSINQAS